MSTPTGDGKFLEELEQEVEEELTLAESGQPDGDGFNVPIDEWLVDPGDAQRDEVGLRNLLGAVEALEHGAARIDDSRSEQDD